MKDFDSLGMDLLRVVALPTIDEEPESEYYRKMIAWMRNIKNWSE